MDLTHLPLPPPPLAVKFTLKKWLKKTSNPLPKPEKMSWSAHASYFKSFKRNTLRVHNYDSCHVLWLVPWSCYHIDNLHFWMENTENKILLTFCKLCKQKQDPNFVYNAKKDLYSAPPHYFVKSPSLNRSTFFTRK